MNDWRDRRSWEGLRPGEDLAPEEIIVGVDLTTKITSSLVTEA